VEEDRVMGLDESTLPLFGKSEGQSDKPATDRTAVGDALAEAADELSFEEAYSALEETVRQLERGDSTIDELVDLYERGMALSGLCNARLDAAELRVSQLRPTADGEYEEEPFDE
jgi:exodeoxyribonuclease VII small subunit